MKITDMKEYKREDSEIEETLEEFKKLLPNLDCIMLVGLDSDGRQHLRISKTSGYKKAFMVQFLNAWLSSWFNVSVMD